MTFETLHNDMVAAMKARDKERKNVISTLIAIAMPPIPGADILCYTLLFSTLGIPAEALVPATAIGILLDYLDTGCNVLLLLFRTACEGKRLNALDKTILTENR